MSYEKIPFLTIWETTRACDLACKHCRASAQPLPLPGELSTTEAKKMLCDIQEMGCNIVVFSGGDPLKRVDLLELLTHAKLLGLRTSTIPAATQLLTKEIIHALKKTGIDQIAFSLDFPTAQLHDSFRRANGTFDKTLEAIEWCNEINLPVQINTTITSRSLPYLEQMGKLVSRIGVVFWEVFFLVPTGRGRDLEHLTAQKCEDAFAILDQIHRNSDFILKITEAPHYRRFSAQKNGKEIKMPSHLVRAEAPKHTIGLAPQAVNSGKGFMFVSCQGDVYPSGFLVLKCGNIRETPIADIYRNSIVFRNLREPQKLIGKCGDCEYKEICGGSRSRAFSMTGNYLASDPWCIYKPSQTIEELTLRSFSS